MARFRWNLRSRLLSVLALGVATAVWADCLQPENVEPGDMIKLSEGIAVDVYTNGALAYRIQSQEGLLHQDSRTIWMENPHVQVFSGGKPTEEFTGEHGKLWPAKVVTKAEDGTSKEETKFDWTLCGGVDFHSTEGYKIQTAEIVFSNQKRIVTSVQKVDYRIPTSPTEFVHGQAGGFEAEINPDTGALGNLSLTGPAELRFGKEKQSP